MSGNRILHALVFLGCALLAASPAMARPRDAVMSGAYRCAVIGDSRQWLDCYYGAAQPARAALGLAPASAAQMALISAPPAASPADQDVRDRVMAQASSCALPNDRQWLDCYYAAAQPMRARLHLTPAPEAQMPKPPAMEGWRDPPPASARPKTGAMTAIAGRKEVRARMASYSFSPAGYFTLTLENGQVWRQVDGDTTYAHWKKPAESYAVRISEGFLGSYNLQVKGLPGLFKVIPAT